MKRYINLLAIAIFLVLAGAGYVALMHGHAETLSQPLAGPVAQQTENGTSTVQVTGSGEVQVKPDSAVISLGVQTDASSAEEALNQNNTKMEALLKTLNQAGIPSTDIQTQILNLGPRYESSNDNRKLVGYTASNVVEVRTDNLDSLGSLIDDAVSGGANTVDNIRFEVSNPQRVTDQARETAFENAQHKAQQLAELANASLGPVIEMQETSNTPGPVIRSVETAANSAAVPISPGSQNVNVQVQVTWTLLNSNGQ